MQQITECATRIAPALLIVDTLQTVYATARERAGRPAEQRKVVAALRAFGCESGVTTVLASHVSRQGRSAGGEFSVHAADAVLDLSMHRDPICAERQLRILRSEKNRFGAVGASALLVVDKGVCVDTGAALC